MSAQDKTEQVLRAIHILFSQSEIYDRQTNRVIVNKQEVLGLLQQLNLCIYEMMEERELTQQSRDAAEREFRKKAEEIIQDAGHTAEDVYAGSVLYTDEALRRIEDIMQETAENMKQLCFKMVADLQKEKAIVHRDQSELKSHLEDLRDTNKYLRLIEERNREIKREKERAKREAAKLRSERRKAEREQSEQAAKEEAGQAGSGDTDEKKEEESAAPAAGHLEIRVNPEYFEKAGLPLPEEEALSEEEAPSKEEETVPKGEEAPLKEEAMPEEEDAPEAGTPSEEDAQEEEPAVEEPESDGIEPVPVEIRVNLDADYFKWKEESEKAEKLQETQKAPEKKPEKWSFFGRKK